MESHELTSDECMDALRSVHRGRVAISSAALPAIEPVNFAVDGDSLVFGAAARSRLAVATENAVVAFQADSQDLSGVAEWSVMVVGTSCRVTDPGELLRLRASIPELWSGRSAEHVVRIQIVNLEGRRTTPRAALRLVSGAGSQR
jgi:nitroimidazol reductase NimA-like FMN-containing flavoprotein (pyridoxamine 5'-phosphate oxidase superfamily)